MNKTHEAFKEYFKNFPGINDNYFYEVAGTFIKRFLGNMKKIPTFCLETYEEETRDYIKIKFNNSVYIKFWSNCIDVFGQNDFEINITNYIAAEQKLNFFLENYKGQLEFEFE